MKKRSIVTTMIVFLLMFMSNFTFLNVNAQEEPLSPPLYFGIRELRASGMGYSIGDPDANGTAENAEAAKLWNIVQYSGPSASGYTETNVYCVKAGVGFTEGAGTSEIQEYDVKFNMYTDRTSIAAQNDVLNGLANGGHYYELLALLNIIYLPGESTEAEKDQLLTNAGIYQEQYPEIFRLTDDEIEAVQQAAIWYFTNADEGQKYNKYNNTGWLWYTEDGRDYSNLSGYNPTNVDPNSGAGRARQDQAELLYKYLIDTAEANANQYADGSTDHRNKITLYACEENGMAQPLVDIEKNPIEGDYQLQLEKVDEEGNLITAEAEFSWTLPGQSEQTGTTTNGRLNLGTVEITDTSTADTIQITETSAPAGYNALIESLTVQVTKGESNGAYVATGAQITAGQVEGAEVSLSGNVITIKVPNVPLEGNYQVQLEKVDEEGNLITAEAGFRWTLPGQGEQTGTTTNGRLNLGTVQITDPNTTDTIQITETSAPAGYNALIESLTVQVTKGENNGNYVATGAQITAGEVEGAEVSLSGNVITITVPNVPMEGTYQVQLEKVDEEGNLITAEAGFRWTLPGQGEQTGTTTNGRLNLGTVQITDPNTTDTIQITETSAPAGYNALIESLTVQVTKGENNGNYVATGAQITAGEVEGAEVSLSGNVITITVPNVPMEGTYQVQLEKVDEEGNLITAEAGFRWTLPGQGEQTGTTTNGRLNLGTVQITDPNTTDTIQITETSAPAGYNALIESLTVQITKGENNGNYVATGAQITAGQVEGAEVSLNGNVITITVPNVQKEFDLSLRKFISEVDGTGYDREPDVDISRLENGTTAIYNHPKDPIMVKRGSVVIYTIRVYNEAEVDGYAEEITDYLPEELEFLPNHEINLQYEWQVSSDGRTVTTDYLSSAKETAERQNLLHAFNGESLDYKDVQIACQVREEAESNVNLTNLAEITEDKNDYDIPDRDSTPDNLEVPSDENLPGYKDDEINQDYVPGQEDDDDFEKVFVQDFDLSLRKFISEIDGIGYDREPDVDISGLESGTTAIYNHPKDPIMVQRGSVIIYTIRVYNEADIDGYVEEITDYLPEELEFLPNHEINLQYEWQVSSDGRTVTTDYLSSAKETAERQNLLHAFNGGSLDYKDVQIACQVRENAEPNIKLTNLAEITEDRNDYDIPDRDSTPDNVEVPSDENLPGYKDDEINQDYVPGQEDDDDFEKVIVQEVTGAYQVQLEKVDEDGNLITAEAGFSWTLPGQSEQTGTTSNGRLNLGTVQITDPDTIDTIQITETSAPAGYNPLVGSITIEVTKGDNTENYIATGAQITAGGVEGTEVSLNGNVITITVPNILIEGNYQVQLEKVDNEGNLITAEAGFRWTLPGQSEQTGTTTEGRLNLGTVQITDPNTTDTIEITETSAPAGYNALIESLTVQVTKGESNGAYVVTGAQITSGQVEGAEVALNGNVITIRVPNKPQEFDLSLRKFISEVDGTGYDREPDVDISGLENGTTAIYNHPKDPVLVKRGSIVIYTIRVYNEAEVDGYAEEITDFLPEELEFLPDHEINLQYEWQVSEDGRQVTTDYLSSAKETEERQNLIHGFDGTTLDYKDVQIACQVREEADSNVNLTNLAEITEDRNDYDIPDRDSTPDNVEVPSDENLPGYKDDEINQDYVPGQEDDDDFEKVIIQEFDLALRKFITKVDEEDVTTRIPEISYDRDQNQITYNHTKDPVEVVTGNVVEYTIRIYNEGDMAGYAEEVADDIPDGLRFLPENATNTEYRWVMYDEEGNVTENVEEAVEIRTDYLSREQEETEGENLLQAFNPDEEIGEGNPDYRDIKVAFEVVEPNTSDRIIVNSAQITEDSDENGNPVEDIDSIPDEWNEGEDDQDREYIKLTYFDLALRKWVTEAIVIENGQETVTQTGHTAEMDPEPVVKVELYRKNINDVTVKFRYSIRITNEGDIAGYATEITDYVPAGLTFLAEDNPGWTDEGNNVISTRLLENTLLQPGESAEVEVVLTWVNGEDNMGQMTNIAEISEDYNDKGVPDRDSTPDNQRPGEDDIDDAPVLLSIETGQERIYFVLGFTVLGTLAGGLVLIKKFVI